MDAGGVPFWLQTGARWVAAVHHAPPDIPATQAILLLPPFGWEEIAAYRGLRRWADELALEGHHVLRIDWPGTGDSEGTGAASGLLEAWHAALRSGARWLREQTGATRVAGLAIGLAGVPALTCAADLDDVVLWGTAPRGKQAMRRLEATALLSTAGVERDEQDTSWVYGTPVPADLREALLAWNASELDLSDRRVLVVDQGTDAPLITALKQAGADVTSVAGVPLTGLVEHPQDSRLPQQVVRAVDTWLSLERTTGTALPRPPHPAEASFDGVRERFVDLHTCIGTARAVVTSPEGAGQDLTVVLLNSGATRRTGPNRMWVDAARRWGREGVTTVRVDLTFAGDGGGHKPSPSSNAAYFEPEHLEEISLILDELVASGLPSRFVLAGLCSGAYWSWQIAPKDPRVVGAVLLNPTAMHYDPALHAVAASNDLRKLASGKTWRKLLTFRLSGTHAIAVLRAVTVRLTSAGAFKAARKAASEALDLQIAAAVSSETRIAVVWTPEEALLEIFAADRRLASLDRPPHLSVHLLSGPGNNHTLAPRVLRAQADAVLDQVVQELSKPLVPSKDQLTPARPNA